MDSRSGKLRVTNERICRIESLLDELITKVSNGKCNLNGKENCLHRRAADIHIDRYTIVFKRGLAGSHL